MVFRSIKCNIEKILTKFRLIILTFFDQNFGVKKLTIKQTIDQDYIKNIDDFQIVIN